MSGGKYVDFVFSADATFEIEAHGFTSKQCKDFTEPFEQALAPLRRVEHAAAGLLKIPTSLVRGVLAERVVVSTELDPFLSLRALTSYSNISVRKLRDFLEQPQHPLPCYRVGGKILVRRSEFDAWITTYRHQGRRDVDTIVSEVLRDLPPSRGR